MRAPGAGAASVVSLALLWLLGLPWTWSAAAALGVYVGSGGWRFLRIVCKTARRDLFGLSVLIRVRLELRRHQRAGHTIPRIFQAVVQRQPERLALVDAGTGECWTFAQLDAYSNAVANLFRQLGFAPGDVVAIFLEGRPEFVGLWLGLAKAGMEAALLNVNLRREPLAFCLGTSGAKALIFGGEMVAAVAEVSGHLGKSLIKFCSGDLGPEGILPDTHLLDPLLKEASTAPLAQIPSKGMDDRLFYIYTSGTTGLPKAAIVVHSRKHHRRGAVSHLWADSRPPQEILGQPLLGRLHQVQLHGGSVHRGDLPLPAEAAGARGGEATPRAPGGGERAASCHLGGVHGALRRTPNRGVLRRHRVQLQHCQHGRQGRLLWFQQPHPAPRVPHPAGEGQ
ncbi:long-chain fatty acid transport protein 1 isoform X4 [Homo sapiens]|uniref:long-chain fatty acid transport protein 1 isoform X4 n=1 Tax=Homo sapiens TaxID=9606 RepID=UPI001FB1461F|nr:long-chain fatty acid transport protein 1 isoform X4 [Homo sapiens]XP_054176916.1 long-chain fatty acid transport protein 1 isoform X4 [Homo sapiens]